MFLHCVILILMAKFFSASSSPIPGNESDLKALRDFKSRITQDPNGIMQLWNDSNHFCRWFGVTCDPRNQRVVVLSLESQGLVGTLTPSIGNLTQLDGINLRNNKFGGEIPPEVGRLSYLRHANFTYNSFGGKIQMNLSRCRELRVFDFGGNNLTGTIPRWIGNFSSLVGLSLTMNNLHGTVPREIGQLKSLEQIILQLNNLSGKLPDSIFNLSSLFYLTVTQNRLEGKLPSNLGTSLPSLVTFACGVNAFSGPVPVSISNASRLRILDCASNRLTGTLPRDLGNLRDLSRLNFDDNRLGNGNSGELGIIIGSLTNCSRLEVLGLARNFFGGEFPRSVANLSTLLRILTLGSNALYGNIPNGIGNLVNLTLLGFEGNNLNGSIPNELGKLKNLNGLYLNVNKLSGAIPSSLGNLTLLVNLFMEENRLQGEIPPGLGRCRNLITLNLSSNNLVGDIPREVMELSKLSISLSLSNNSLTGSLPFEVGELDSLSELDVSVNLLSGEIPSSLGKCLSLERLSLARNGFEGKVPESLRSLKGLREIDLSNNNLSGLIPSFLGEFTSLERVDLSYNSFEGEVLKEGVFGNATAVSVVGNDRLCGGIKELLLPPCLAEKEKNRLKRAVFSPKVIIPVIIVAMFVIILASFFIFRYTVRRSKEKASTSYMTNSSNTSDDWQINATFLALSEATNGFSGENLIGSGSFGSVYKGIFGEERKVVAVKVLNLRQQAASKSFVSECKALRSVRHRNLLKIITACSSIDHEGNEFKSLVFEFMENGNLDEWLHPIEDGENRTTKRLNFLQRLNIAIDVASALDYLHNYCETAIVHCDLKPSNVLLDRDMVAHVGDFGLVRFVLDASQKLLQGPTMSLELKGSIGYIPPEYGMGGKISIFGDSYSYGILLLEMFMGKRPTDDTFKDGLSIRKLMLTALSDHDVTAIVDPSLLLFEDDYEENESNEIGLEIEEEEDEEQAIIEERRNDKQVNDKKMRVEEYLVTVMRIGLLCSNESPKERLLMSVVANSLRSLKDSYLKSMRKRRL